MRSIKACHGFAKQIQSLPASCGAEDFFHRLAKRPGIDRREAVQFRLNQLEVLQGTARVDQPQSDHGLHVVDVLRMAAFHLCQRLRVQVEMEKRNSSFGCDERAAGLPAWRHWDEVGRRCQLDVDPQLFFQPGERPQQVIQFRLQTQIDIDRAAAPARQDGGDPSREVDAYLGVGLAAEGAHEAADAIGVGYLAHSTARA